MKMKYVAKPYAVEAVQWTGNNLADIEELFKDSQDYTVSVRDGVLLLQSHEDDTRTMNYHPTDWVINFEGAYGACSDEKFKLCYEHAPY